MCLIVTCKKHFACYITHQFYEKKKKSCKYLVLINLYSDTYVPFCNVLMDAFL
jgi:hypothetical protein